MTAAPAIALACLLAAGCLAADEGRPPIARIDLDPGAIPEDDAFRTPVTLDGRGSADPIDDPEGAQRLLFHWELLGDEGRFEEGSRPSDPAPVVRFRGNRPPTIRLTVTDPDGLTGTTSAQLRLTVRQGSP
jgi:hypothetical protein